MNNFELTKNDNLIKLHLKGNWQKSNLLPTIKTLDSIKPAISTNLHIDFSQLKSCDSCSIIYLISFIKRFDGSQVVLENLGKFEKLYNLYLKYYSTKPLPKKEDRVSFVESVGEKSVAIYKEIIQGVNFLGQVFYYLLVTIFSPKTIRFNMMLKQLELGTINSLFIVAITSFLVGVVIAYQGAVQLEKFGANIFIVEMITITMFREIAPLMTAIVIAGRSASSYTAEIGAMKITEEINAMKTMGFEPNIFLTIPRIIALVIGLPLLIFFSDIISVTAGAIVAFIDLGITFGEFIERMRVTVEIKHFFIGIFKGLFFGIAIAMIGCYHGFKVKNNTTSIGINTTLSVVAAIFVVIALNAIFSVILTQSGI